MPVEIVVPVENKPGTLATVAEVLGAAGVNIQCTSYATGVRGVTRLIADDTDKALVARRPPRSGSKTRRKSWR